MTEKQASTKLTTLSQKKDDDLYTYYYWTEILLIDIPGKDKVIHDGENIVIFIKGEQNILKDTIAKLGFGLKIPELHL